MVAPIWSGALKEEARLLGSRPRLFGLCHCDSHSGAALGLVVGRAALAWPATHLYEGRLYLSRVNDYRTLGSQLCVERLSSSGPIVSPCDLYYSCCDKFTIMSAHTCAAFNSYQTLIIHLVCMTHLFVTCTRVYFFFVCFPLICLEFLWNLLLFGFPIAPNTSNAPFCFLCSPFPSVWTLCVFMRYVLLEDVCDSHQTQPDVLIMCGHGLWQRRRLQWNTAALSQSMSDILSGRRSSFDLIYPLHHRFSSQVSSQQKKEHLELSAHALYDAAGNDSWSATMLSTHLNTLDHSVNMWTSRTTNKLAIASWPIYGAFVAKESERRPGYE